MRLEIVMGAVLLMGCPPQGGYDGGIDQHEGSDASFAKSSKAALHFKGPEQLETDLTSALQLPADGVCNEMGQYSCNKTVHVVALGGVDPYTHSVYEPSVTTGATTPIVVDRVVLAACTARVTMDVKNQAGALIFKNLPLTADGKLPSIDGAEVRNAIGELAQRAWLRDPGENEVTALVQLAHDLEAAGGEAPGRAWMQAACFVAFSSAEAVFY